jgi:hypothetical protein
MDDLKPLTVKIPPYRPAEAKPTEVQPARRMEASSEKSLEVATSCNRCNRLERDCTRSNRAACDQCHRSHVRCSFVIPDSLFPGTGTKALQKLEDEVQRSVKHSRNTLISLQIHGFAAEANKPERTWIIGWQLWKIEWRNWLESSKW